MALDVDRQPGFLGLAFEGPIRGGRREDRQLDQLLGQGTPTLHPGGAAEDVGRGRPDDPDRVDPVVLVEAPVLDGDDGVLEVIRHLVALGHLTLLGAQAGDDPVLVVIDCGGTLAGELTPADPGSAGGVVEEEGGSRHEEQDDDSQGPEEDSLGESVPAWFIIVVIIVVVRPVAVATTRLIITCHDKLLCARQR